MDIQAAFKQYLELDDCIHSQIKDLQDQIKDLQEEQRRNRQALIEFALKNNVTEVFSLNRRKIHQIAYDVASDQQRIRKVV
jgi:hypothetical protein